MALPELEIKAARTALKSKDFSKARKILVGNLDESDSIGTYNLLAFALSRSPDNPDDLIRAKQTYKNNAIKGDPYAQHALAGILKSEGKMDEAIDWMTRASQAGRADASYTLFLHFKKLGNKSIAFNFLKTAASQGDPIAVQRYAIHQIKGNYGYGKVLPGIWLYFKNAPALASHVNKMEHHP